MPSILELESYRTELIDKTFSLGSYHLKLLHYIDYFDKILALNDSNIEAAFLEEFIFDFVYLVSKFEVWGIEPSLSSNLLTKLKGFSLNKIFQKPSFCIIDEINRIDNQFLNLHKILNGEVVKEAKTTKYFFPLIDKEVTADIFGLIDSVTVRISKTNDKDKFIIIPSEKDIEFKLNEQNILSWNAAINLSTQYLKKTNKYHEIIISFDKKFGLYEGNSLGVVLTLSFIQELLKFYNSVYLFNIKENCSFTGGIASNGVVLSTGDDIIEQKSIAIFYSHINYFIIPKEDENHALYSLSRLKNLYPNRKIKIIPVETLEDIINRRDICEIKKQSISSRASKFLIKNVISISIVFITLIFVYLFAIDLDDNPANVFYEFDQVFIKNKNNKNLFSFYLPIDGMNNDFVLKKYIKIVDINNDNENEVLVVENYQSVEGSNIRPSSISCFDKNKKRIWNYYFNEVVSSEKEIMFPEYGIQIVDTISEQGKKIIVVYACNANSFATAVFKLNLLNGKKVGKEFWCSGHIASSLIADINNDKKKDFIGWGADNGFNESVLFAVELSSLNGFRSSTKDYRIKNKEIGKLLFYLRIPRTDYDKFAGHKRGFASPLGIYFYNEINIIACYTLFENNKYSVALNCRFNTFTNDINIFINDLFRVKRDSLVLAGKLKGPLTDTKEYINILRKQVLFYKNGKWVNKL